MLEQLIGFYGYKSTIDAKISKVELQTLSVISRKYSFKTKRILSPSFYRELYTSAPLFNENIKIDNKKQEEQKKRTIAKKSPKPIENKENNNSVEALFSL